MAWSLVGVGTVATPVTATPLTLTEPAGVADGDLLVACIASRTTATTAVTSTGWTAVNSQNNNNTLTTGSALASGTMLYRVRSGTPTLTFTLPAGISVAMGCIVAYRGNAATTPLDVSTAVTTAISTTAVSVTGLTTTQNDDLIVAMAAGGQEAAWSSFNATTPSGASGATDTTTAPSATWRERADSVTTTGADTSLGVFDALKTATGATGNLTVTASVSAGHVVIAGAFKILPTPTADAWNINDKSAAITLSASDKTATATAGGAYVRSTKQWANETVGKYYAEVVADAIPNTNDIGLHPLTSAVNTFTNSVTVRTGTGILRVNSVNTSINIGAFVAGDIACVAWDAGAERIWVRKNNGLWNNDASANPATGANGYDISANIGATYVALWYASTATANGVTLRTELAEFTQIGPSGFTSWMGEALGPTAYTLPASAGSYALIGQATSTELGRLVTAVSNSYALTGATATLTHVAVSVPEAWNANDKTAGVTLSNGDYTASLGTTTKHVRSTQVHAPSGKYYAEFLLSTPAGGQPGVASATVAFATQHPYENGASFYAGDPTYNAGPFVASDTPAYEIPALASSDVICLAIDYGNSNVWFRVNGGIWNNSGTANPATNTGGLTYAPADDQALFASNYVVDGAVVRVRTETADFTQAVPSGFTAWVQPLVNKSLSAVGGSYALTGAVAGLYRGREVLAVAGSYSLTGVVTSLEYGRETLAVAGAYALTGTATSLELGKEVLAVAGAYALTGQPTSLELGKEVLATGGSYALSGVATSLEYGREVLAVSGSYSLTGQAATFRRTWRTTAIAGAYSLTGAPVNLLKPGAWAIIGLPGSYALTGQPSSLEYGREILATGGSHTLGGTATSLEKGREVAADPGSYALSGMPVNLLRVGARAIVALPGNYVVSGVAATLFKSTAAAVGQVGVWNGSAWVDKPVKVWTGSTWVVKPVKHWNGSAWV